MNIVVPIPPSVDQGCVGMQGASAAVLWSKLTGLLTTQQAIEDMRVKLEAEKAGLIREVNKYIDLHRDFVRTFRDGS